MKKEPFKNLLLRFFRKCEISYQSIAKDSVLITGKFLNGLLVSAERTRCAVSNFKMRQDRISVDMLVDYSIEAFLYKLFKYSFINEKIYSSLLKLWLS